MQFLRTPLEKLSFQSVGLAVEVYRECSWANILLSDSSSFPHLYKPHLAPESKTAAVWEPAGRDNLASQGSHTHWGAATQKLPPGEERETLPQRRFEEPHVGTWSSTDLSIVTTCGGSRDAGAGLNRKIEGMSACPWLHQNPGAVCYNRCRGVPRDLSGQSSCSVLGLPYEPAAVCSGRSRTSTDLTAVHLAILTTIRPQVTSVTGACERARLHTVKNGRANYCVSVSRPRAMHYSHTQGCQTSTCIPYNN